MSKYILSGTSDASEIVSISVSKSYEFNPKSNSNQIIKIKKISVYDEEKIQKLLVNQYIKKFKRLSNKILSINEDDDSDSSIMICFDEISRLKDILTYKYKKYLKKELYEKFISDLLFLSKYLESKLISFRELKEEPSKQR